jgi:uncharacterized protein with HEPN domain
LHIVVYSDRALGHLAGVDRQAFAQSTLVIDAVERCIERVCEAVYRLGADAETYMPGQPWNKIRGMANRLRHGYDAIESETVWDTATIRLPSLRAEADAALARLIQEHGPPGTPWPDRKEPLT